MRFSALALVATFLYGISASSQTTSAATSQATTPQTIEAEIRAVEMGLLPVITVAGDHHPTRSLSEEMRRRHVPAVSIAVIHNGIIRWAHAWGTLNPEGGAPATADSLFQAASISKSPCLHGCSPPRPTRQALARRSCPDQAQKLDLAPKQLYRPATGHTPRAALTHCRHQCPRLPRLRHHRAGPYTSTGTRWRQAREH